MALTLTTSAFRQGGPIGRDHSCDGQDLSPPLSWEGPPGGTGSFALVCEDPDAPAGTWVHWVIYNVPASTRQLPRGVEKTRKLPDGSMQGKNDFGRHGYGGPCPPPGKPHRYYFRLYALDSLLEVSPGLSRRELQQAMEGHVLGQAGLYGTYARG